MGTNQARAITPPESETLTAGKEPRSSEIAKKGIKTGNDFAGLMSSLMSDIIEGRVSPSAGNATCKAGGKLLKLTEMQYKHGMRRVKT
jgi:hypothetical protein